MYSPTSSIITTYSQDVRIANYLESEKSKAEAQRIKLQSIRKKVYEKQEQARRHEIFKIPAIDVIKFTCKKIEFVFRPSLIYENISETYSFNCSLRYVERFKKWKIGREPMPALAICRKVTHNYEYIDDNVDELYATVCKIYTELKKWSKGEIMFRRMKFEKYKKGELSYLDIDEVDKELYFSPEEIEALNEKRDKVLRRMIPPPPKPPSRQLPERAATKKSTKYFIL